MSNELERDPFGEGTEAEQTTSPAPQQGPSTGILGKWYVLFPLCAAVLLGALYLGLRLQSRIAGPVRVTLAIDPQDAIVLEAGKELAPAQDGTYLLAPGKHELTFRRDGYRPRTEEYVVSQDRRRFEVKLNRSAETPVAVDRALPDEALRASGTPFAAIGGTTLIAPEGAEIDADSGLPARLWVASPRGGATMELVLIKPGDLELGVSSADLYPGELAPRRVRIERPFYLAATETTNEQYAEFAEAVGDDEAGTLWKDLWQQQGSAERLPVVGVSVAQAKAFCAWLGGRLPTEEQWEFAARASAGDGALRPWGNAAPDPSRANLFYGGDARPVPVDALPDGDTPSGLKHMLGNVAEWCSNAYRAGFGEDESAPELAGKTVIRGGSFTKSADADARLTWRAPEGPEGTPDVGFRVVFHVELADP